MSYTDVIWITTIFAAAVVVLIALTNIFTQVIKKIINREKFQAQVLAFVIAEILTMLAMVIICTIFGMQILWYFWILAFVVGVLVCYGAIFGYDNLYNEIGVAIKALIEAIFKKEG